MGSRGKAGSFARRARRLPDEGQEGRDPLHREGQHPGRPGPLLLPEGHGPDPQDPSPALARDRHRNPGHAVRTGSPDPREQSHQAPPAALQRGPAGRQKLPVPASADQGGLSPFLDRPQSAARRRALLRPVRSAGALRETLRAIKKIFPLATCTIEIDGKAERPCIEYEIKRCMAPCVGYQTSKEYHEIVKQVRMFLEGRNTELLESYRALMEAAAEREDFEEAARIRDRIFKIERTLERQRVAQTENVDQDVVGLIREGAAADIQMLFVRGGLLVGRKDFHWGQVQDTSDEELVRSVIEQFYSKDVIPPKQVLLPIPLPEADLISQWLSEKKGEKVLVLAPERGIKHHLVQLAEENAVAALRDHLRDEATERAAVEELRKLLHLKKAPTRIEGFDISNIQGNQGVASMVVWEAGGPKKSDYRKFRIKTVAGANDFASMKEVVLRHYSGVKEEQRPLPDLILIDGGIGQLGAAMDALRELGLSRIDMIALAKAKGEKEERVFLPGRKNPVVLKPSSPATHVLQLIRDEAHRFAIT